MATCHDDGLVEERVAGDAASVPGRSLEEAHSSAYPLSPPIAVLLGGLATRGWATRTMGLPTSRDGHGCALAALPLGLGLTTHWHDGSSSRLRTRRLGPRGVTKDDWSLLLAHWQA